MNKLDDKDLINIKGGELSSSLINSISKITSTIYPIIEYSKNNKK